MLLSLIYGNYIDCGPLADLAYYFGMDLTSVSNLRNFNCCNDPNITCDINLRVIEIVWINMGFSGTFNSVALNSLTKLNKIEIYNNYIKGSLPTSFPPTLVYLDVSPNQMSGSIPVFHNGMQVFWGDYNNFSGNLPAFPSSMLSVYLSGMQITGTLSMSSPYQLYIDNTLLTGINIANPSSLGPSINGRCDISGSKIYQEDAAYLSPYCLMSNLLPSSITTFVTTSNKLSSTATLGKPTSRAKITLYTSAIAPQPFVTSKITLPSTITSQQASVQISSKFGPTSDAHISVLSTVNSPGLDTTSEDRNPISPSTAQQIKSNTKSTSSKIPNKTSQLPSNSTSQDLIILDKMPRLPDLESSYSYMESAEDFPNSTHRIKNSSQGFFAIERIIANPIFYFGIGLFIFFLVGMLVMRKIQQKKRTEAKAAKDAKRANNNGGQTELTFHL